MVMLDSFESSGAAGSSARASSSSSSSPSFEHRADRFHPQALMHLLRSIEETKRRGGDIPLDALLALL